MFDRLDELLPEERRAAGVASTADFLLHDIPPLIDLLAEVAGLDEVVEPEVDYATATLAMPGGTRCPRGDRHGVLVAHLALYVILADDGAVEIIYLEIDDGTWRRSG